MFEAKLHVAEKIQLQFSGELLARGIDMAGIVAFHRADYGRILILSGRVAEGRALIREALASGLPFPHRDIFLIFSWAAALIDYRLLAAMQRFFNRIVKYRNVSEGAA
jgi:hypothetical protein